MSTIDSGGQIMALSTKKKTFVVYAKTFVIIFGLLSFAPAAHAQHNDNTATNPPIDWSPGQVIVKVPLTSPSSQDSVLRKPAPGESDVGPTVFERYFLVVGDANGATGDDNYVSVGETVVPIEKRIGLYGDNSLSGKDYLTEVVNGDCIVKGIYIFPAGKYSDVGIVVISASDFPYYGYMQEKPTVLYKFILKKRRLHNEVSWYLSYVSSQNLGRYYCLEEDYLGMVSRFAEGK
jgi:hypothetical protein